MGLWPIFAFIWSGSEYTFKAEEDGETVDAVLNKYDAEGNAYTYAVEEAAIAGYATTYSDDTFDVTNKYGKVTSSPTDSNITVVKEFKDGEDAAVTNGTEFKFNLAGKAAGTNGSTVDASSLSGSGKRTDSGNVEISEIAFNKLGTYAFELSEEDEGLYGITYDPAKYILLAAVTDENKDGEWEVSWKIVAKDGNDPDSETEAKFENTYDDLKVETVPEVTKELSGHAIDNTYKFSFVLFGGPDYNATTGLDENEKLTGETSGAALDATNNKATEVVELNANNGKLTFTLDDLKKLDGTYADSRTFTYLVYEQGGNVSGVTYDTTPKELKVTLNYVAAEGYTPAHLEVAYNPAGSGEQGAANTGLKFENSYDPSVATSAPYAGKKQITDSDGKGRTPQENEFVFQLKGTDEGTKDASSIEVLAVNDANGNFSFGNISFSEAGTYVFKVKELQRTDSTIQTWDTAERTLTATVAWNTTTGALEVEWEGAGTGVDNNANTITFTNVTKATTVDIPARAVWAGDDYTAPNDSQIERRPASVTVKLQKQDASGNWVDVLDSNNQPLTVDLTKANNWADKFIGQPAYDSAGNTIKYQVVDTTNPSGYTAESKNPSVLTNGGVVVYTYETATITGTKKWVDGGKKHNNSADITLIVKRADDAQGTNETTLTPETDYHVDWSGTDDANFTIRGLEKYKAGTTTEFVYTVDEREPSGYTKNVTGSASGGYTITNTIKQEYVTVKVDKKWVGAPTDDVTVTLSADGTGVATHKFASGDFGETGGTQSFTFTKDGEDNAGSELPKYNLGNVGSGADDGSEIAYTVAENPNGNDNFTSEISGDAANGYVITNTNTETVDVYAVKVWAKDADDTSKRAAIQFQLTQTVDGATKNLQEPKAATDGTAPYAALDSVAWTNLPKYVDGKEATYAVNEVAVPGGYGSALTDGNGTEDNPYQITNTLGGSEIDIPVMLKWVDSDNKDGVRPSSVEVVLQYNAGTDDEPNWQPVLDDDDQPMKLTLDQSNNGTGEFTGLPSVSDTGKPITYRVVETETSVITGTDGSGTYSYAVTGNQNNGFVVTNTHTSETVTVKATKQWAGETPEVGESLRTNVVLHLYGTNEDGDVVYDAGTKTIAADANPAEATWADVDKYHFSNDALEWKIVEELVFSYSTKYEWNSAGTECTVTNTYSGPTTQVKVTKEWQDNSNIDSTRPAQVEYKLYKKVGVDGEKTLVDTQKVKVSSSTGAAEYTWYDLPVVEKEEQTVGEHEVTREVTREATQDDVDAALAEDPNSTLQVGDEITDTVTETVAEREETTSPILYSVEETKVAGYDDPIVEATAPGEFNVINKRAQDTAEVKVAKTWDDDSNSAGLRPDHITVQLTADGTPVSGKTLVVTADANWNGSFGNLPKNSATGTPIEFSVQELTVPGGYTSSQPTKVAAGGTISVTNTLNKGTVAVKVTKVFRLCLRPATSCRLACWLALCCWQVPAWYFPAAAPKMKQGDTPPVSF